MKLWSTHSLVVVVLALVSSALPLAALCSCGTGGAKLETYDCDQTGCGSSAFCGAGTCIQTGLSNPSCSAGNCNQKGATNPTCDAGGCCWDSTTTGGSGCAGGGCDENAASCSTSFWDRAILNAVTNVTDTVHNDTSAVDDADVPTTDSSEDEPMSADEASSSLRSTTTSIAAISLVAAATATATVLVWA